MSAVAECLAEPSREVSALVELAAARSIWSSSGGRCFVDGLVDALGAASSRWTPMAATRRGARVMKSVMDAPAFRPRGGQLDMPNRRSRLRVVSEASSSRRTGSQQARSSRARVDDARRRFAPSSVGAWGRGPTVVVEGVRRPRALVMRSDGRRLAPRARATTADRRWRCWTEHGGMVHTASACRGRRAAGGRARDAFCRSCLAARTFRGALPV